MFIGTTFHSCIDRLSIRSVLGGKSGTLLGVICSIILIVICILVFIGPIINYFKGDFVQASFARLKTQNLKMYSGCDFKMALSFYNKQTKQIVDYGMIQNLFDIRIVYASPDGDQFSVDPEPCRQSYFEGYSEQPSEPIEKTCYRIPDKIGYFSQSLSNYVSVIGFQVIPLCDDPFTCTFLSIYQEETDAFKSQFFKNHYYEVYFTSQQVDRYGQVQMVFHKAYSTQWETHSTLMPYLYIRLETQTVYIDDSIMPWRNNITHTLPTWYGHINANEYSEQGLLSSGVRTYIATLPTQELVFREYKKLDWLLGMVGGGIFLLYVFFYIPMKYLSGAKNQMKVCESMLVLRKRGYAGQDALQKPNIGFKYYLTSWLPNFCKINKESNKLVSIANRYVDIANLIKKQKITLRNIRRNQRRMHQNQISTYDLKKELKFKKRQLDFSTEENMQSGYCEKLQLPTKVVDFFQKKQKAAEIYMDNQTVLTLNETEGAEKGIATLEKKYDNFSREKKSFQSSYRTLFKKFRLKFASFIRFFDIFGAKPMLSGHPHDHSYISTIITLTIVILAILTFALTIYNMEKARTRVQHIFVGLEDDYRISMKSSRNYKLLFCTGQNAIDNGLVMGQQRVADIKFYQYHRDGEQEIMAYYDPIWIGDEPGNYFDLTDEAYETLDFTYCFKPVANIDFEVYGSEQSNEEAYFGVSMKPYCSGTVSYCNEIRNQTVSTFKDLLNLHPLNLVVPDSKYIPEVGQILSDFKIIDVNIFNTYYASEFQQSFETHIFQDAFELVDDTETWSVGKPPEPHYKTLTTPHDQAIYVSKTVQSEQLYYQCKIKHTGQVIKIISVNYKLDFLFATFGGCFMIFYMIFGCFGKMVNTYFLKVRLARELYSETDFSGRGIGCIQGCLKCFRIPCADNKVVEKISRDLDCISIAQRTDTMCKLSSVFHSTLPSRQLSQVYLKQIVKEDDKLLQPYNQEEVIEQFEEIQDEDDIRSFASLSRQQKRNLERSSNKGIANEFESKEEMPTQKDVQIFDDGNLEKQPVTYELNHTNREKESCKSIINTLDLFTDDAYLTLDGKKTVTSMCGGVFCIILLIFIILLTQHYMTIYFQANNYVLSYEKAIYTELLDEQMKSMQLKTGENFKFLINFSQRDDFLWKDVFDVAKGVGIAVIKTKIDFTQQTEEVIDMVPCPSNYLDGFINEYQTPQFYQNITLGFCIPDGTQLTISGTPNDKVREYFKVSIYNKQGTAVGKQVVQDLLGSYIPVYHISYPIQDFREYGDKPFKYGMREVRKFRGYQDYNQVKTNITLINTVIEYDTAVNPNYEFPTLKSYDLEGYPYQVYGSFEEDSQGYLFNNELAFQVQNYVSRYTVKRIKANELLGLIGGAILFVFFGIGILPRSFNHYRMVMLIGAKLYCIQPTSKILKTKATRKNGEIIKREVKASQYELFEEFNNFSEWRLFRAWCQSFWGFIRQDYEKSKTLRMVTLIESRVSNDLNVLTFLKNMLICESYLNNSKELQVASSEGLNLCRIFPKISIPDDYSYDTIDQGKIDSDLRYLAKKNDFSDWDINTILIAKNEASINPVRVFEEKWLDDYFKVDRKDQIDWRSDVQSFVSFARLMEEDKHEGRQESSENEQTHSIE